MDNIQAQSLPINGLRLHIRIAGDPAAPLIMLLHGFPDFSYGWRHQLRGLARAGYHVWAPDLRGCGESEGPPSPAAYALDVTAQDVLALLDAAGYGEGRPAYLVGHDWGGALAWWVANKYPSRVAKLAILNVPHHRAFIRALRRNPAQRRRSAYMAFFQWRGLSEATLKAFNCAALTWVTRGHARVFEAEALPHYQAVWRQKGRLTTMLNWYRAARQVKNQAPPDPHIPMPTLLLWGERDIAFLPSLAEDSLAFCPQGRLLKFSEASHWLQWDESEAVTQALADFFRP